MSIKSAAPEKGMEARKTKPNRWLRFYRCIPLYLMFLPGALYLLMDKYIPMAGLVIAFKKINWRKGIWGSEWVGFSNFTYLFKTKDAFNITRNTILYNLTFIVLGTVIAITVAILLNEIASKRMKQVYQTIILLPYLISIVVVSYLVFALLSAETGFINNTILKALGVDPISWYTEPKYWPFILVIVHIWKVFGYDCILYYATLVGIDHGYYEAAVIDGANRWQQIVHVTLPNLLPTIITLTMMSIGKIFYSDFGLFYQVPMDSGPLLDVTSTIDTYVYRGLITLNNIGMSSAAGVYQSVVGFVLVLFANWGVKKIGGEENGLF
ncbi:MAG: ABC transporter permease [Candidatus Merdivicinus sp.]|jgi:putative aldouronate transport system permease protein